MRRTRLREMTPADVPAVLAKLKEQNERDGTAYALPRVFDEQGRRRVQVPLALVAVDVKTGEVVQGHVWERTLEQMSFGMDAAATLCSMKECEAAYFLLRERGYEDVHVLVPAVREPALRTGLMKVLKAVPTGMKHFYRLLDAAANERLRDWYRKQERDG